MILLGLIEKLKLIANKATTLANSFQQIVIIVDEIVIKTTDSK